MQWNFLDGLILVKIGDITDEAVDAIVNAANSSLMGGAGVDGAIHRRGGPAILQECKRIRAMEFPEGLPTGRAVITTGGNLPADHVIHTVGPIYGRNAGRDAELLADCYRNSIRLAAESGLESIAFPAISTGVYGFPKPQAAAVAARALQDELKIVPKVSMVRMVFFSAGDAEIFVEHCGL